MASSGYSTHAPDGTTPLRFGYTFADLKRIGYYAALDCWWAAALPWRYRVDLVVSALAERIYSATEEPSRVELRNVAKDAVNAVERQDLRHHGINRDTGALRWNFARHWYGTRYTPSPEDTVVEPLALEQIWHELPKTLRIALQALADYGTNPEAAAALGVSTPVLATRVSRARAMFLGFWHEGERPSPLFSRHRPRDPDALNNAPATASFAQRRRRVRGEQGKRGQPLYGRTRRTAQGVSDAELARRFFRDGAALTELGRQYGTSRDTVARRIKAIADAPYRPATVTHASVTIPADPTRLPDLDATLAATLDGAPRAAEARRLALALLADAIGHTTHRVTLRVRRGDAICLEVLDRRQLHPRNPPLQPAGEQPDPLTLTPYLHRHTTPTGLTRTRATLPDTPQPLVRAHDRVPPQADP